MKALNRFYKLNQNMQGQSMVEFAVAGPILVLFLLAILYVSDLYIVKAKTIVYARYGAWQLARNNLSKDEIKEKIAEYFSYSFDTKQGGRSPMGNLVGTSDKNAILIDFDYVDLNVPDRTAYKDALKDYEDGMNNVENALSETEEGIYETLDFFINADPGKRESHLKVTYRMPSRLPNQIGTLSFGSSNITNTLDIYDVHYVDGNTWNGYDVPVHDVFQAMFQSILNFIWP